MPHTSSQDYIHLIRARGFRATPQRQIILDVLRENEQHLTAEEIYQQVRLKTPTLNRATVYRTLDFLCELRLVVAADMGAGRWVYEMAGATPHHHLVCRTCGATMAISQEEVQGLYDRVLANHDFMIDMDHLALFGLCSQCRNNESSGHSDPAH
jgi:Fur family ferric uptake transcriptional regulator